MEILILDKLLRPIDVVDTFVSMIWTERYFEAGDFELTVLSTYANRKRFVENALLSITESLRVMEVNKIEETADPEKGRVLKVTGSDLISILNSRLAVRRSVIDDEIKSVWTLSGFTPSGVMLAMFNAICVDGRLSVDDIIPFIQDTDLSLYPADTIPLPSEAIRWEQKPASLYDALKELADIYDLGIRLYKNPNASMLYFNVYAGSDRTSGQTILPPVIFSQDMENLENTTEYSDVSNEFNVIQVMYIYKDEFENEVVTETVVMDNATEIPTGLDRKVKVLVITNIPEEFEADIPGYLTQSGEEELRKSRPFGAFDGEISQFSDYIYEKDYYLGDLVEVRGITGAVAVMRVAEQIFVQDGSGQRSYPTLITKQYINPGTWLSWKYDVEWTAMGSEEYWGTQ